jgi:hypothetical protein
MEKIYQRSLAGCLLTLLLLSRLWAQGPILYGAAAQQDSLWGLDTTTYAVVLRRAPSLPGLTVTGITGLAYDPIGHATYCLLRTTAFPNATFLATINLATGACTQVGNLNFLFSSITFRADGQLIGVVGDGGANAEKLYLINKATAATSLAANLGNGDTGEVICYRKSDGMLYHWSGNVTMVFEKFPANMPFTPVTAIPTTGAAGGEQVGALDLQNGNFMVAGMGSTLRHVSSNGQYGSSLTTSPAPLCGMVMPPQFRLSDALVCVNELVTWSLQGIAQDTAVYDWGDGTVQKIFPAGPATHVYLASGSYVTHAGLKNAIVGLDTMISVPIHVNPLPGVALNPSADTILCLQDTLVIQGSFGGTSRWFRNGILIPGATTNVYAATLSGWYNMTKTNTNGCIDSAATGISVTIAHIAPAPTLTADTSNCPTVAFQSNDAYGTLWSWDFGDGGMATGPSPMHTYSAIGTYPVSVVASNACYTITATTTVEIDCFIGTPTFPQHLVQLVPNPSQGHLRLQTDLASAMALSYTICDLQGRILYAKTHHDPRNSWSEEIDFQAPPGLYFVTIQLGDARTVKRLLIE